MDDAMNGRLRDQERALRDVIATFSRLRGRGNRLGSGSGWVGAASAAYGAGLDLLRAELGAARAHLDDALADTLSAIDEADGAGQAYGDSCG